MRDAISGLIGRYDQLGRYFDRAAIDRNPRAGGSEVRRDRLRKPIRQGRRHR